MMLCIAGLVGLLTYSSWVSPFLNAQTIRDWEDYDKYREGLFLFPEARPEATINDYFYMNAEFKYPQEHKVFNLYLDVTYNAEQYAAEIQRFQSYSQNYVVEGEAMTGMLIYDKDDVYFNYETYIAEYNYEGCYEYVLLVGDNRIVYIHMNGLHEDDLRMPKYYLPKGYDPHKTMPISYCVYSATSVNSYLYPSSAATTWKIKNFGRV